MIRSADFIAVDWGTTNRRAYRLDGAGRCTAQFADDQGMRAITPGGFPRAAADLRERLGALPMLLAGMVGANRGWVEAPYVPAPAGLDDLARMVVAVATDVAIVPGVSVETELRVDVMRGEEVQALGALVLGLIAPDSTIIHPGTHAKWITLAGGRIVDVRTAMTGETFALLRTHSVLAPQLTAPVTPEGAFRRGVAVALGGEPLLDALFGVRAGGLFGRLHDEDAASYASGLVIGTDVRAHIGGAAADITVLGDPALGALYRVALAQAGREVAVVDGARAFIAGMTGIQVRIAA